MIDIIICEDNDYHRNQIENIVVSEMLNLNYNFKIQMSTKNPDEVIRYVKKYRSDALLCFLDIELDFKTSGMELARIIRKINPMGYIVFITSHVELTLLTFEYKVQAMDYIIKGNLDYMKKRIAECIIEVYNDSKNALAIKKNSIKINIANKVIYFNLDDILFFETSTKDHKIRIHTCDEQLEFYGVLKQIEKEVTSDYYKVHRSYLINTKKIKAVDKKNFIVYMINGEKCYVSEKRLKGLLDKWVI
ncbi:DNA-binding response regulator [Clostridium fermenticellae]|uniref:Stage 0 sporulation protein A homolog n=1 Tax=Clostridium fermenticellae TaxID=2068654 RepID=A0A386H1X2_9CLOT|nr:LytTR family DNA-binding domain-containing protein [Clostridium fermenticellae]AYD39711.1 DNA-binding response regulator [Clostridium fermenticellae]